MVKTMFILRHSILAALLVASVAFSTQATAAANIGISPTQINLSPSSKTGVVTVLNKGEKTVNLQLDAKSWDMDENGKFIETDTGDFVFYPKVIAIKPQEQASIRVGYTSDFPKTEKSYRLFIEEVPEITQAEPEKSKVNIGLVSVLRLSLPLYVVPVNEIPAPQVELSEIKAEKSIVKIGIKNPTAYHVTLKKIAVKLLKGNSTLVEKTLELKLQRILGEHRIFVDVPLDAKKFCSQADALSLQIDAENLAPPFQSKVALKSGCQL